jgi:hypothetical protein
MPDDLNEKHFKLWAPAIYRIEVEGHLDESWSDRLVLNVKFVKTKQRC